MTSRAPRPSEPREIELKLGLPSADAYARLRQALDAAGGFVRAVRQENLYLDGTYGELSAAGVMIRVRVEREDGPVRVEREDGPTRVLVTLKAGGTRTGDVTDRPEWECALPLEPEGVQQDPSRLLTLDLAPVRELLRRVPRLGGLRSLGGFSNDRRVYCVTLDLPTSAPGAARVQTDWELDRTEFPDGSVDHELEVELGHLVVPRGMSGVPSAAASPRNVAAATAVTAIRAELALFGVATISQHLSKYARFRERMGS